jgi:hypothetical protein
MALIGSIGNTIAKSVLPTGSVLQVIQGTHSTQTTVSSATYVDSGLTATITPTSASSKILVIVNHTNVRKVNDIITRIRLLRASTDIFTTNAMMDTGSIVTYEAGYSFSFLDSPNTTSAVTYKTQINSNGGTATHHIGNTTSFITLLEIVG